VIDTVGGDELTAALSRSGPGATTVTLASSANEPSTVPAWWFSHGPRLIGMNVFDELRRTDSAGRDLAVLVDLVARGLLDPRVSTVADWHDHHEGRRLDARPGKPAARSSWRSASGRDRSCPVGQPAPPARTDLPVTRRPERRRVRVLRWTDGRSPPLQEREHPGAALGQGEQARLGEQVDIRMRAVARGQDALGQHERVRGGARELVEDRQARPVQSVVGGRAC
jgi:hypothetical protein